VRRCRELPGYELFQYIDEEGQPHILTSTDVNEYLSSISAGGAYTAKDFRTWAGTVLAALALQGREPPAVESHAKKSIADAVRAVTGRPTPVGGSAPRLEVDHHVGQSRE